MKTKVSKKTAGVPAVRRKAEVQKATRAVAAIAAVDPQALLVRAIDKNLPIESMERLLAMRDKMKAEWARDQFFAALAGFQSECPIVEKNHKVMDKDKLTKADKGLRYAYAAIEDLVEPVRPLFIKWGLSWTSKPTQTREDVTANIYLHHKDGHEEVTSFTVPIDPAAYMSDPQKVASALTFATRYAFKSATGIQTKGEDNDAQQDDEPRRRTPIAQPQEKGPISDTVPVAHEEGKQSPPQAKRSGYDEILFLLQSISTDPKTKQTVKLFNDNEVIDYTHQAKEAKDRPEELKVILADVVATGKKRHAAVRGEA